jgi:threonine/homoserine/homoserine lactone efflux protein
VVELTAIFASSFVIALSGAMMPGPLLTVTIGESTRHGTAAGPLLILGHALLEFALLVALMLGLKPFLQRDAVFTVIALVGAVILVWMALGMLRSLPGLTLAGKAGAGPRGRLVVRGVLMSLANPYWTLWWATIGLACVSQWGRLGWRGAGAFFLGHISGDLAWYTGVAAAVARGRRFMSDRAYRGLMAGCAACLVAFAWYFAYSGVTRWLG